LEPFLVGLPVDHQLANRNGVRFRELTKEDVIWLPRSFHPSFYDRFLAEAGTVDYRPKVKFEVTTLQECLDLLTRGQGITFVTRSSLSLPHPGVVFIELREQVFVETLVTFRFNAESGFLRMFLGLVKEIFGSPTSQ